MHTTTLDTRPDMPICNAILRQDKRIEGPFTVESLSASIIRLRGRAPRSALRGQTTVALAMPDGTMLHLDGTVTSYESCGRRCMRVSLQLQNLTPDLEDQIQEIATKSLERNHMPWIIALDRGRLEALDFQRALNALGRQVIFAHDGIEAVWLLEGFRNTYSTILIDQSFIQASGTEILPFLRDQYGDKRRVLVRPQSQEVPDAESALAWSVHGVLTSPWTTEHLQAALGLFPARHTISTKRILFVDDEPSVLAGLQDRMRKDLRQHETVWVTSGEVALSESQARPFDVVVTDLRMPGMDGLSLLRNIKNQSPQSKRIMLTGFDAPEARDIADVVLHKPCPPNSLRVEVLGPS
jgi:CheY-like chemotaxis protein